MTIAMPMVASEIVLSSFAGSVRIACLEVFAGASDEPHRTMRARRVIATPDDHIFALALTAVHTKDMRARIAACAG